MERRNMETKTKIFLGAILLLASFAIGRFTANSGVNTDTKDSKVIDTDSHVTTTIVETKKPDGETQKTTVIKRDTDTIITDKKETQTETTKKPLMNVSVLAGLDYKTRLPAYGATVSKEFIGPITLGVFGLTNGVVGITVGLDF